LLGAAAGLLTPQEPDEAIAVEAAEAPASAEVIATSEPLPTETPLPTTPLPAGPIDEQAERNEIQRSITTISGVERAAWTSRSTLALYLSAPATDVQVKAICALVERNDSLRAIRLQLQPPPGSTVPVRFMQCRAF